uniref:Maturase n=1 Tax=Rhodochaete parvula TaxID=110510 RepID=A0A1C9CI30_9RHOD|nr:maturase [Rhodochaete parvula]
MTSSGISIKHNKRGSKLKSIYYPSKKKEWTNINWSKVNKTIENIRKRIIKLMEKQEGRKIRNLQRLLNKSLSVRLYSVRIVTEPTSKYYITSFKQIWRNNNFKLESALQLRKRLNKHNIQLINKTYSINKYYVKAHYYLIKYASQINLELTIFSFLNINNELDYNTNNLSYNYNYSQLQDLISQINNHKWILTINILYYLKKIQLSWLLNKISVVNKILIELLPLKQFAIRSFINYLKCKLYSEYIQNSKIVKKQCDFNILYFSGNLIVTTTKKKKFKQIATTIKDFFKPKIKITIKNLSISHIKTGFIFKSWHIYKHKNSKIVYSLSKKHIYQHLTEIKNLIKNNDNPVILITKINNKIECWKRSCYKCSNILKTYSFLNKKITKYLLKWGCRRHNHKSKQWIIKRYWKQSNNYWNFFIHNGNQLYLLTSHKTA